MDLILLKGKIHTVKVTEANVEYRGSITIDEDLMDAADIVIHEQVHVNNATRGTRIITYAIPGKRGSGEICMNGGAALHSKKGDTVHILAFAHYSAEEAKNHHPKVIQTTGHNQLVK